MRDSKRSLSVSEDTRKIKKILNEEARLGIDAHSDSESEAVDLHKELHPLSYYMNNREEMIEQMFGIIKGSKLKKMLPPILKDMHLDELKADCLIHLLGMSTKRIHAILEGKEISSSSDSETQSDDSTSKKSKTALNPIVIKQEGCSDISDNSEEVVLVEPDLEFLNSTSYKGAKKTYKGGRTSKKCHIKRTKSKPEEKSKGKGITQQSVQNHCELEQNVDSAKSSSDNEIIDEVKVPTEGKTLLEILELEMRARAIRALLHKSGTPDVEMVENPVQSSSKKRNEKSTSVKNIRKNKKKSEDVIVIAPKLVTIDLTDENDPSHEKAISIETDQDSCSLSKDIEDNPVNEVQELNKSPEKKKHIEENISEPKEANSLRKEIEICSEPSCELIDSCKKNSVQENSEKVDQPKSNWAQRWLESKEVKKVVSTSKICGNIRKKFKNAKLAKKSLGNTNNIETESQVIQGSVVEYQSLPKSSKIPDLITAVSDNNPEIKQSVGSEPVLENVEMYIRRKETNSVEQVQDISSTETPPELSICKSDALCSTVSDSNANDSNYNCVQSNVCDLLVKNIGPCELKENLINPKDESNSVEVSGTYSESCETGQGSMNHYKSKTCKYITLDDDRVCSLTKDNSTKCTSNPDDAHSNNNVVVKSNTISNSKTETCKLDVVDNDSSIQVCKSELLNIDTLKEELRTYDLDIKDDSQSKLSQPGSRYIQIESSTSCGNASLKIEVNESQVDVNSVLNIDVSECKPNIDELNKLETTICESVIVANKKTIFTEDSEAINVNENPINEGTRIQECFSNEPETLEIDITDEDREIDRMMDEQN